jgi:2-polyprenyl-3-methyl-5-hydroxy-6-metoxy-1,4-benzoquinol methylase
MVRLMGQQPRLAPIKQGPPSGQPPGDVPGAAAPASAAPGKLGRLSPDSRIDVQGAARLHAGRIARGWRARLAEFLLRRIYAGPLVRDGLLRPLLHRTGDAIVGLVAYSARPRLLRGGFFRRHLVHSLAVLLPLFLVAPEAIPARRATTPRIRAQRVETDDSGQAGEIFALIAGDSAPAADSGGPDEEDLLVHQLLEHLCMAGIPSVVVSPAAAAHISRATGDHIAATTPLGGGNRLLLALRVGQFESENRIPASWAARVLYQPRPGHAAGWKAAWEYGFEAHPLHRFESEDTVERLARLLPLTPEMRVLDFGCGFGYVAERLAERVGEVAVWDQSASIRRHARQHLAGCPTVRFFDPDDVSAGEAPPQFDLILVNSVVQYMTEEEFHHWLPRWRAMLAPGGVLVLADLIPSTHSVRSDVLEVLRFALRHGVLLNELGHSARTLLAYARHRQAQKLMKVEETRLREEAARAGLELRFSPHNLTVRSRRWTTLLQPLAKPETARA